MNNKDIETGTKYVLTYYAPRHPESAIPYHPPFETLEGALAIAWHNRLSKGQNESIMRGHRIIFNREDLERACARMEELMNEQPPRHVIDIAEQVVREMSREDKH